MRRGSFRDVGERAAPIFMMALIAASSLMWIPNPSQRITSLTSFSQQMDSWPTFHHDSGRSGFTGGSAPLSPRILWKFPTGSPILSSPVIANGTVYVASTNGHLYALNQTTGNLIWRSPNGTGSSYSAPVIYGDAIYTGGGFSLGGGPNQSKISALNRSNGDILWSMQLPAEYAVNPYSLLAVNGRIYFPILGCNPSMGCLAGNVLSIDATNGSLIWNDTFSFGSELAYAQGLLFVKVDRPSTLAPMLFALNATTGASVWNFTGSNALDVGPTVTGGVLYVGGASGLNGAVSPFYALDASTGSIIWSRVNITGLWAPAVAYGRLFISQIAGIEALSQSNGSLLWYNHIDLGYAWNGQFTRSVPVVADGLVFDGGGTSDPTLYALNASSGALIWSLMLGGDVDTPAIADGVVYVGAFDGQLYAVGTSTPPNFLAQITPILELTVAIAAVALMSSIYLLRRTRRSVNRGTGSGGSKKEAQMTMNYQSGFS